jgi:hypothetical protein
VVEVVLEDFPMLLPLAEMVVDKEGLMVNPAEQEQQVLLSH